MATRYPLEVIPEPLIRYRLHGQNLSTTVSETLAHRDSRFSKLAAQILQAIPPGLGSTPRDSLVVVASNALPALAHCLVGAVKAAPMEGLELIVVDNASTDESPALLQCLAQSLAHTPLRYRVIRNEFPLGFTQAANQGFAAATGDRVLLLTPEARLFPGAITRMRAHFAPGVGAVGPTSDGEGSSTQRVGRYVDPQSHGQSVGVQELSAHLAVRNAGKGVEARWLAGFCLMVSRQALERVGQLDESLFLGNEDLEYCWRLREHGYALRVATDVFVAHRGQGSDKARPQAEVDRLLQDSTDVLAAKLAAYYGPGRVPSPRALWGIESFKPSPAVLAWPAPATPADGPQASLVVLTLNQLAMTRQCFDSVFAHTGPRFELIVVDNGSTDGTRDFLAALAAQDPRVKVIYNDQNMGFAHGCNQGLAIARGEVLVLLNNDTVVTSGWLEGLMAPMARDHTIGAVGPRTNRIDGAQQLEEVPYRLPDLDGLPAFAAQRAQTLGGQGAAVMRLVGFCLAIRRAAVGAIGGLDTRFSIGNYEDDDYCLRLQVAGYRLWMADDVFVHHWGSQTFKAEKIDALACSITNFNKLARKWGVNPVQYFVYDAAKLTHLPFKRERDHIPLPLA